MTCEHLKDDYELHALGLSDGFERAEIEFHLKNGCENCSAGVRRALVTNVLVMQLAPDMEPPRRLRKRVLASVGAEPARWNWGWALAAGMAALLVVNVWLGIQNRQNNGLSAQARQTLEILNGAETKQVVFGSQTPAPPQGRVLVNPKHGILLIASNLPKPPAGKTYEMWLIPKGGTPKPAGLFQSDSQGAAMYLSSGPVDVSQTSAVAVTLEAEAGAAAPTSTPVIVAALGD
jgi:hypothetical protein